MKAERVNFITEGNLLRSIFKFLIPLLLAILLQSLYGAIDLVIVGKFVDSSIATQESSAVAMGGQIVYGITCLITGLSMGASVVLGKYVGAKNNDCSAKIVTHSIYVFSVVAVILTVLSLILAEWFVQLLNVPKEAVESCVSYVRICSFGLIFITGYNVISGLFRGLGNSLLPLIFVAIACVINIGLDFLFIVGFKMKGNGAGYATITAQAFSVIISLIFIKIKGFPFKIKREHYEYNKYHVGEILKVGLPIGIQDFLTHISFLIISSIVNTLGVIQSNSIGIAEKAFVFLMIIPISFMSTIATFVAQNIGAGNQRRAEQAFKTGMIISAIVGVAMFVITAFYGEFVAKLFTNDESVIFSTADYLKGTSVEYLIVSLIFCITGYLNGLGKSRFVMIQGFLVAFVLRIPLSFYISKFENVTMFQLGLAVPISAMVTLITCTTYLLILKNKTKKESTRD